MDDKISEQSSTNKNEKLKHDPDKHSHSHNQSQHDNTIKNESNIDKLNSDNRLGKYYDEFYVSGVD